MFNRVGQFLARRLSRSRPVPDVRIDNEEEFLDLTIPVLSVSDTPEGSLSIRVLGNTPIGEIGFDIEVLPEWKRQDVDDSALMLYWGTVRYRSIGAASDRFLALMADQYGLASAGQAIKEVIEFTAVSFGVDPGRLKTDRIDMKLFLDGGAEDSYAEVYTNIDLQNKCVEVREKDPEYRVPLSRGLAAQSPVAGS